MREKETKQCPFCCEEIIAAAIKCKHCNSDLGEFRNSEIAIKKKKPDETIGHLLIIIPIAFIIESFALIWMMDNSQHASLLFNIIGASIYFITAILATIEANNLGIGSELDLKKNGKKRFGPLTWFFFIYIVWGIGYPCYLYHRSKYGMKNHLVSGIIISISLHITLIIFYLYAPWK